jgi:hypothetical protein
MKYDIKTIFDTDVRGRTRTFAWTDKKGEIINLSVTEGYDEKGRKTYTTYQPYCGETFNRFTNRKKEKEIIELLKDYL